jgi:hypothetical protein
MSSQNMIFGFIPKDWDTELERISVGDPAGSQTTLYHLWWRCMRASQGNTWIAVKRGG